MELTITGFISSVKILNGLYYKFGAHKNACENDVGSSTCTFLRGRKFGLKMAPFIYLVSH